MKPGRELDVLVAKKVMGLTDAKIEGALGAVYDFTGAQGTPRYHVPNYSTNIAAAWEVIQKLSAHGSWEISGQDGLGWRVSLNYQMGRFLQNDDTASIGRGSLASHAICLAALKALGVEL